MKKSHQIYIGNTKSFNQEKEVTGDEILIANETFYKVTNVDAMRPFFMSIVSNSNHWMFIASNGGLTAGRKDSNSALFPYYTDDKLVESANITGTKTVLRVHKLEKEYLYEPFSDAYAGVYEISRNVYKNSIGNKVIFEEINHDLEITYSFEWNSSDQFGFVKKSTLINTSNEATIIKVLDGLQNILPCGVGEDLQKTSSNLVDAYKRSELLLETGVGMYALSAIIVDKAEPSEALKTNVVWSTGISNPTYLASSLQVPNFRKGLALKAESDVKAEKGAYFVSFQQELKTNENKEWHIVANVNQSVSDIVGLNEMIKRESDIVTILEKDIKTGTKHLMQLVAASDGLQLTADTRRNSRHFSNTMFNIMRGGIFDDNYNIEKTDFLDYMANANKKVYKKKSDLLQTLPSVFDVKALKKIALSDNDANFKRLCFEYLPLKFSRRHGDPSRPWNKFSINTKSEDGSKILDYEGNWRDIFQNWEALAHAYPEFIEGMIHKFLNATTFEGYNPYRVTKGGFDWETIEPDNPWSYIGYWGDHQIIYLLKFLEFIESHKPGTLESYFTENMFVYANVPYRIKSYEDILKNPKDTIGFDDENQEFIELRRNEIGVDGALLRDQNYFICKVNFIEKLLATTLSKMSNFIPEAGIWMNTQRPEWNDANNALVGNGVSMVTLYYLRRFFSFFQKLLKQSDTATYEISEELVVFLYSVVKSLTSHKDVLSSAISNADRKRIMDALGGAGSTFREQIYDQRFSGNQDKVSKQEVLEFIEISLQFIDHSIKANKRTDELYHAYNLMTLTNNNEVEVSYLSEMLEGQVAVLSSGYLTTKESVAVLDNLKRSALFRKDQYSYILYPNKELPGFLDRNNIPSQEVAKSALLQELLANGNTQIIEQDCLGNYHFNGNFNNVDSLRNAVKELPPQFETLALQESELLDQIFESIFNHKAFTGRSGTFYGYEGLGSIYWHMVSKLQLAVQEITLQAIASNEDATIVGRLFDHYFEINQGIGAHKSPKLYGGFSTDPYSHTPFSKGVQQPGMTGQVKEDILSRFGELGVIVEDGEICFKPDLLRIEEFLEEDKSFKYVAVNGAFKTISLEKDMLVFTYCQVPIIYRISNESNVQVFFNSGAVKKHENLRLDKELSKSLFERDQTVQQITVNVMKEK